MKNNTMESKAVYGIKAYADTEDRPISTAIIINGKIDITMDMNQDDSNYSGFLKYNTIDRQKKEMYRSINKKLGGY